MEAAKHVVGFPEMRFTFAEAHENCSPPKLSETAPPPRCIRLLHR